MKYFLLFIQKESDCFAHHVKKVVYASYAVHSYKLDSCDGIVVDIEKDSFDMNVSN